MTAMPEYHQPIVDHDPVTWAEFEDAHPFITQWQPDPEPARNVRTYYPVSLVLLVVLVVGVLTRGYIDAVLTVLSR